MGPAVAGPQEEVTRGEEILDRKAKADAEVYGAGLSPVRDLRSASRLHAEVRHVSHLFPGERIVGVHSRGDEVQLVGAWADTTVPQRSDPSL